MSKRKQKGDDIDEDGSDVSLVDIEFDFFDPVPDIDYLALKHLANQLFQGDAQLLHIEDLADLILAQPQVGTTIKCDGKESDPYAFLTVINLHIHQNRPSVKALLEYAVDKSRGNPAFHAALKELIGPQGLQLQNHVGFVFSERLINMPVQLMPVAYKMLAEELKWAADDNEPFRFSHYLFMSQTYTLSAEEAAELESRVPPTKKQKGSSSSGQARTIPVHPEDAQIAQLAAFTADFAYSTAATRESESFGLDLGGRLMLMPAELLPQLVDALAEAHPAPQT